MRKNLFQTNSFLNQYQNVINNINLLEDNFKHLSDSELRAKIFQLKKAYQNDFNLKSLIVESFDYDTLMFNYWVGLY